MLSLAYTIIVEVHMSKANAGAVESGIEEIVYGIMEKGSHGRDNI